MGRCEYSSMKFAHLFVHLRLYGVCLLKLQMPFSNSSNVVTDIVLSISHLFSDDAHVL